MSVKLLVIDRHEVVRLGLRAMLSTADGIEIVADTYDLKPGVELINQHKPDVVLLDVHLQHDEGVLGLQYIREHCPQTPVVVFAQVENSTYLARAIALGAVGILLKSQSRSEIIEKLLAAAKGEITWSRGEQRRATAGRGNGQSQQIGGIVFTGKELEVLQLLIEGLTNKEIAQIMKISYETVKEHIQHLLRKIQVSDRTQAAIWAIRNGISNREK